MLGQQALQLTEGVGTTDTELRAGVAATDTVADRGCCDDRQCS